MKRIRLILACGIVTAMSTSAWAGAEISGFGGYQFGGRIPTSIGEIDFKDDITYGGALEIPLPMKPGSSLVLWYNRMDTEIRLESYYGKTTLGSASINYFQAGGLYNVDRGTPVVPFTMFTLGATWLDPSESAAYQGIQFESVTKFSFMLGGGVKYWSSDKVALRIQFNLAMTLLSSGAYFGVGTGGANVSVGGSGFAQGSILGGVTFKLGS